MSVTVSFLDVSFTLLRNGIVGATGSNGVGKIRRSLLLYW